jgi:putative membrane protein insertion efficiency factor
MPANAGEASWAFGALMTRQFLSVLDNRNRKFLESSDDAGRDVAGDGEATEAEEQKTGEGAEVEVTAAMVASIGFYKKFISPLLPPACRFLPTCSQYGVQAIEQFGPTKGAILTAWRLLRCSPIGGRGYDPPKWPPVAFNYGSY